MKNIPSVLRDHPAFDDLSTTDIERLLAIFSEDLTPARENEIIKSEMRYLDSLHNCVLRNPEMELEEMELDDEEMAHLFKDYM